MGYHRKNKMGISGQLWRVSLLGLLSILFLFGLANNGFAATQWVSDPATCNMSDPTNFPGQNCDPDRICGDSSGIAQCYNTASLLPPAVSATSNTLYSASYPNGGYILNCYAAKDGAAPFCDNSGSYWCNRSNTCYTTQQRDTTCTASTWATATCGACRSGFADCNGDLGVCEVQYNVTDYTSGTNNHYGVSCLVGDVRCDSGYYDCDATGVAVGNGCEALRSGSCTTGGGLTGTWSCAVDAGGSCTDGGSNYTCVCVPPKQYFETGTEAQYATVDPLLWGVQYGVGDLIHFGNGSNSDLFVVQNDGSVNLAQITAPAITTDLLYNVGGTLYWNGSAVGSGGGAGGGWVDDGTVVRLETATDYVGIGNSNPHAKLDIGEGTITTPSGDTSVLLTHDGGDTFFETASTDMAEGLIMHSSAGGPLYDYGVVREIASTGYTSGWDRGLHIFTGDNNEGSPDPIMFTIDGNEAMRIIDSGNIGIGTTSPFVPLQVRSAAGINTFYQIDDNSRGGVYIGNGGMYSGDEAGLYDAGGDYPLAVYVASNDTVKLGHEITVDVNTGFIGMAEASPVAQLEITDRTSTTFEPLLMLSHGGAGQSVGLVPVGANPDGVVTSPRGSLAMDYNNGMLYINRDGLTDWQSLMVGTSIWDGDTDTGIEVEETLDEDYLRFYTAGTERMRITNQGNIQMGTGGHLAATLSVNGMPGQAIAGFRDSDGEDIFSAIGRLSDNNFQFIIGDTTGIYPNSYNGSTGILINQASESITFGRSQIRFQEGGGGDYVGFLAPASVTTPVIWTLPATDGTAGQALTTNGAGILSWSSAGGAQTLQDVADYTIATDGYVAADFGAAFFEDDGGGAKWEAQDGGYQMAMAIFGGTYLNFISDNGVNHSGQVEFMDSRPLGDRRGIEYVNDYSADFTARSLVDKAYVDSAVVSGSGWTDDGTVVRLTTITDNVGIGTTSPSPYKLYVQGTTMIDAGENTNAFMVYNGPNGNNQIRVDGDANNVLLSEDNGYVGIGLSYPTQLLHMTSPAADASVLLTDESSGIGVQLGYSGGGSYLEGDYFGNDRSFTIKSNSGYKWATFGVDGTAGFGQSADDNNYAVNVDDAGRVGVGTSIPDRRFQVEIDDTLHNVVTYAGRLVHTVSGLGPAPTTGFGTGLEFELENGSGINRVAGTIENLWASASNTVENSDMAFKTMQEGVLTTGLYIGDAGNVVIGGTGATDRLVINNTPATSQSFLRINGEGGAMKMGFDGNYGIFDYDWTGTGMDLSFQSGGNEVMVLNDDGSVQIGMGQDPVGPMLTLMGDTSVADAPVLQFRTLDSDIQSEIYFSGTGGNSTYWNLNSSGAGGGLIFMDGSTELLKIASNNLVYNEGADTIGDIRFESPTDPNAFYYDTNTGFVGLGTSAPGSSLSIYASDTHSTGKFLSFGSYNGLNQDLWGDGSIMTWDVNRSANNGGIDFETNGTPLVRIRSAAASPGLSVETTSRIVGAFNRKTTDGVIISLQQDGVEEGTISVSGTTVSYNAFTGSHYTWHDGNIDKGMVVSLTGKNKRLNDNEKSEVLYGVEVTNQINSPKVLGSYLSILESQEELSTTNPALVMAVGNGEVWVADKGENIEAGDYLISSDVAGHAQKMDADFALNYVFARAAEDIDWSTVNETSKDGVKHKMITVFFDSLVVNTQTVDVIKNNNSLGSKLNLAKMTVADANKVKKQLGGEIKAGSSSAVGSMQVGQATIPGKNTSVRVTFANEYSAPPIVMLTLASDSSLMRYFVSNVTEFGFTLNLYPSQYQDTLFNWQAYPASGVQSSETVSQPILEDLPEYEVPAVIPPQDDFLPIVPDKEDNTLNLNGAEDVLYNDGLSIVEVGDSLGEDINSDEDVSDDVPVEEPVAEVVEEIVEEPVVPEAPADVPTAPEEPEVPADGPTEILE